MIELKDFITTMQTNMHNYILNEVSKGILNYSIKIAVDVNEERCKEWIKQAIEIETFTPEQVENLKIKHYLEKKDKKIKELEHELSIKNRALELACQHLDELYLQNSSLGLYKLLKIENSKYDYFIEQAKESK